ncbi:MAG: hypothetical protein P8012_14055 [Desulfobacterales bacterium]|jgi:hypothetical protein
MTTVIEKDDAPRDYYKATLENGSLVMEPRCACGNPLNDDYVCDKCNKKCHCRQIICDNETTLELVKKYIRKSPQFSAFTVKLADSI